MSVFLSALTGFLLTTLMFAFIICGISYIYPNCVGGVEHSRGLPLVDSFQLSWTTFSTVGYGMIHSGTSSTDRSILKCSLITFVVSWEAYVGVLFSSICVAVMFAKLSRIQSFAQVTFSDPIVVRFGPGVSVEDKDDESDASEEAEPQTRTPCPLLEFRINNRLNSLVGGEIIDAVVTLVASIDAAQACPTIKDAAHRRRRKKRRQNRTKRKRGDHHHTVHNQHHDHHTDSSDGESKLHHAVHMHHKRKNQTFDEDPSGSLVSRRIFSKLDVETPDHPFFKRVWIVRHRLDDTSPLLKSHARQLVRDNNGYWPQTLCNHAAVREAIHFDQILVSMSGTSNADANSVYAQKAYDFSDVCIGYRFVNQLYRDPTDGSLRVDTRLINDVTEQAGLGGEPLSGEHKAADVNSMLVL